MIDVFPRSGMIKLGKQGENRAIQVILPNIRVGAGSILLLHQRALDKKPYPVPVTESAEGIIWVVSSTDTANQGRGQAELQWLGENGEIVKSVIYQTETSRSLSAPGAVPDEPMKPYIQAVAKDAQAAKDAAASAKESAQTAEANATQAGTAANNAADSLKRLEDGIASGEFRGEKGEHGDPGPQGPQGEVGPAGDTTAADAAAEAAKKAAQEAKKAAETAVLYTEQNLTDSQQEQARTNINAADKARQNILVGSETGNPIAVDDAFAAPLCGLTVYGKSTQDGTPTPDAPVPIVSAGDGGTITVTIGDGADEQKTITLQTPNGLPGIPVTSGGNYTDENGQRWVCDEVDLERGVMVQRIASFVIDAKNANDISVMNPYAHVNVVTSARLKTPQNTSSKHRSDRCVFCEALPWMFNTWASTVNAIGYVEDNRIDFAIENSYLGLSEASTNNERKTALVKYFTGKPCRVVYIIATPIETPLTPAEIAAYKTLTAYAPDTVVQANDGAGVKLDYQRDVNIVIKNLEDTIASMTAT